MISVKKSGLAKIAIGVGLLIGIFTGCAKQSDDIVVISREDGSGTKSAFMELVKIKETSPEAMVTNSTSVMMTTVAGNKNAIGYVSMGFLNNSVKSVKIENYEIIRPFNIVLNNKISKENSSEIADFINFIFSKEGQAVVEKNGFISIATKDTVPYSSVKNNDLLSSTKKITVAGSSSVTPLMEKLKEAYLVVMPNINIEIQLSDSSTGVSAAKSGIADIGMASRDLKQSEKAEGIESLVIARDGIAVIVNNENPISKMSIDSVRAIFSGETAKWSKIGE